MTEARLLMFRRRPVPLPWAGIIESLHLAAAHRMTRPPFWLHRPGLGWLSHFDCQ